MSLPRIKKDDVLSIVPEASDVGESFEGGQKLVFPCIIDGDPYVVKFMLIPDSAETEEREEIFERANREVEILRQCESEFIVRLGPFPLRRANFRGQDIIFFFEEYVDGEDLKEILGQNHQLPVNEIIKLAKNINAAIKELWDNRDIHRDIKPGNIMRRSSNGNFVLLDMGYILDLDDRSLTRPGFIPGTPYYLSPEHIDITRKRQMDFRSDHFNLGIVLYVAATGKHPFRTQSQGTFTQMIARILTHTPLPVIKLRPEVTPSLNAIIMRLLKKRPYLRYNSCEQLGRALVALEI